MTGGTQLVASCRQHPFFRTAVWFMAIQTGIFDDRMDIFHLFQLGLVIMTGVAELISRCDELIPDVAGMNVMTGLAVIQRRRMFDLLRCLGIVTFGTKENTGLGEEPLLHRIMRRVAPQTIPVLHRGVNRTLPLDLAVVTFVAKGGSRRLQQSLLS